MTNKLHDDAYPEKLRREEAALINQRRKASISDADGKDPATEIEDTGAGVTDATAIAISGGGVRSATFALGVFQAFASTKFLRRVDYLSTVSGGGYFGGFFCGLFARKQATKWSDVEATLRGSDEINYLRDNGRYLAPAGSDDLWLLISVVLRNWLAVLMALSSAVAFFYLGLEVLTVQLTGWLGSTTGIKDALDGLASSGASYELALSPWLLLVPLLLVLVAVPLSWAYWLASTGAIAPLFSRMFRDAERRAAAGERSVWQRIAQQEKLGTFVIVGVTCAIADGFLKPHASLLSELQAGHLLAWIMCGALAAETVSHRDGRDARPAAKVLVAFSFAAIALAFLAIFDLTVVGTRELLALRWPAWLPKPPRALFVMPISAVLLAGVRWGAMELYQGIATRLQKSWRVEDEAVTDADRDHFSRHSLSVWLSRALVVSAAIAAIAVVQSISRTFYVHASRDTLAVFFAGTFGAAFGAQSFGRKVMSWFSGSATEKKMPVSGTFAAYVAGLGLTLALVVASTTALLLFIHVPCDAAAKDTTSEVHLCIKGKAGMQCDESSVMLAKAHEDAGLHQCVAKLASPLDERVDQAALLLGIVCLVLGSSHMFLNSSSQLPIYTARITRTFLGASNPKRMTSPARAERKPKSCFEPSAEQISSRKAATQLMPGDDIALGDYWSDATDGPYAYGAPLHIINVTINETVDGRSRTQQADRKGLGLAIGPRALSAGVRHHVLLEWDQGPRLLCETTQGGATFSVFDYVKDEQQPSKRVFDGETLSIGRWLGISGAAFSTGTGYRTNLGMSLLAGLANVRLGYWWDAGVARRLDAKRFIGALLWTHQYLRRELLARFPGTANKLWYLSDGGHFENMATYELIRRRVPRIVLLDAGCDPDYSLEDLGNLVRKARLDFGTEITFLEHAEIANHIHPDARKYVGTLAELARAELSKPSTVHAALARVRYPDVENDEQGLLLFIKPTIVSGEPADVVRYHSEHPEFPHETTLDQFFGEPQWESYRALGQHIGARLCVGPYGPFKDPPPHIVTKADPRPQA
jgi:hypothetical protein